MKHRLILSLVSAALAAGLAMPAGAEGPIGTVERGTYVCELPGDANGPRGRILEGQGFTIKSASRYTTDNGHGTYLRRGDELVMTSGPHKGDRYAVISASFLRKMEDGKPGRIRCIRKSR
ncbi:hypothetical protein FHS61_001913 [Altererythrobacter atlanticus]|uniref:Uncharacterized protein n=1 Tax=Croceibacterium atlanticum TaxID=1267766 RepID=A0A0F7KRP9_9SPHN|nr:hypothetical protein [Croceibacterium atlanticum]AKH41425.1 hypothetical protein WYH_00363 [Croceibacterium atlanticum]MBB5732887.1 hypothetical protein [Croceibacterium atlanticum]